MDERKYQPLPAVILAGGRGLRLNTSINKCLIWVGGKPLIQYSLDNAKALQEKQLVSHAIVVTGYQEENIREALGRDYHGLTIEYAQQRTATTLGAISATSTLVNGRPFLLMLGDEVLLNPQLDRMLEYYHRINSDGVLGGMVHASQTSIKKTYSIELERGQVIKVVEKPTSPEGRWMGTGNCILPAQFFEWIPHSQAKGIQDFVTCVQHGIDSGAHFFVYPVCESYFNINTPDNLRYARQFLG